MLHSRPRTMRYALCALAATCASAAPVTNSDAARMRSLGYRASEIAAIRPNVASVVAKRGLPRPRSGMPPSWVDEPEPKPSPFENVAHFIHGLAEGLERLARALNAIKVPIGLILAVSQAQGITLPRTWAPRADPHAPCGEGFLFDGPCDPSMR